MVKSTLSESDIRDLFISPVIRRAGWDPSPIRVSALATTKAQFRDGPFSRNFLEPRSNPRLGRNSRSRTCPRRRSTSIRDAERNSVHRDSRRAPSHPLLRGQRDIDAELWAASEWAPKIANFVPSKDFQEYAEQRGMPVWRARRYGGIAIIFPLDPAKRSLCHEWKFAPARDRIVVEITLDHIENASGILTDVRLERLNWLSCFERPRQSLHPSKDLRTSFARTFSDHRLFQALV